MFKITNYYKNVFRIHVKFQEEVNRGDSSDARLLRPKSVLKLSELPFIVIFYDTDEGNDFDTDFPDEQINFVDTKAENHVRRKRFVEITPELDNDDRNYYAYTHDDFNDVETKIVPIKHRENNKIDENKNGIEDIDEEDELFLDYEEDDMSEVEAKSHRFKVTGNKNLPPMSKKVHAKSRGRKKEKRKRR